MAVERNKWIDAVGKLIQLTQEGKLIWNAQPPSDEIPTDADFVYVTRYKDHTLRLYDNAEKFHRIASGPVGRLELIDEKGHALWTFPHLEALNHLLLSVEYQVADVKDFLKDILSEV